MSDSSPKDDLSISRRSFLKVFGSGAAAATVAATTHVEALTRELEKANAEKVVGPEAVPITLKVNGKMLKLQVEPRVTLLEALRDHLELTGSKEVCDRATCGACTVLVDNVPVYACSKLAIEAQGQEITTIEGIGQVGNLSKVQQAFVEEDAMMCGYCTPGFVMSVTALLKEHPHPTEDQVRRACSGNLCRCGAYPRVMQAALRAAGVPVSSKTEVIPYVKLA